MLSLIPLSKTCSFDWLGWNFYRRINLHYHEAFQLKGGSRLFDRALIPKIGDRQSINICLESLIFWELLVDTMIYLW